MSHFEIFILNFNGAHFLFDCLSSLRNLQRAGHSYQVNVIDNGSLDGSAQLVAKQFPEVNYYPLGENLGFSAGNNAGVLLRKDALKSAGQQADFYVFLNNDTAVEPGWLLAAASSFEVNPDLGIVGCKSLFFDPFIVLSLETSPEFQPSHFQSLDSRRLGIILHEPVQGDNLLQGSGRTKYLGAYSREGNIRWLSPSAKIYLPVQSTQKSALLQFTLSNRHPAGLAQKVDITVAGEPPIQERIEIEAGEDRFVELSITAAHQHRIIQNAGSFVTNDWEAGDIGYLEIDSGQYEQERPVAAVCGVSLFIRSALFDTLGGFDEHSFAYFEDTDLSVRAQLKGWKCVYIPQSRLRHVHCGSGVENSNYFNTNVTYSRFLFGSKVMARAQWKALKRTYWAAARREFRVFQGDRSLEDKPFLRTIGRYVKYQPLFLRNRLRYYLTRPDRRLKKLLVTKSEVRR